MSNNSKSVPISDLIKDADQIEENSKMAAQISSQANRDTILFVIASTALALVVLIMIMGPIIINYFITQKNDFSSRIAKMESAWETKRKKCNC